MKSSPLVWIAAVLLSAQAWGESPFHHKEVMIPMRDGAHLQTVILTPVNQQGPLPILLRRTPYGVPAQAPEKMAPNLQELAEDGYIFVIQNLRGRFKSEGVFELSSQVDLTNPKSVNETTDAYDTSTGW
jgi:predicted acyl esterase